MERSSSNMGNGKQEPAQSPARNRNFNHRRTLSEDCGLRFEDGNPQNNYPPSQISYSLGSGGGVAKTGDPSTGTKGRIDSSAPPGHHRVRSWSGNHHFPQVHPSYLASPGAGAYSPSGNMYVPIGAVGQGQGQFAPAQYSGSRRKRKDGGHRRVQSYSDTLSYGSFPGEVPAAPVGPPPSLPTGRNRDFSPRSEIMNLAGGFRSSSPTGSLHAVPHSPQSSVRGMDPRLGFSFGPPLAPRDVENGSGRVFGMNGEAIGGSFGGTSAVASSSRSGIGGEAVFMAQKKTKHRKAHSSRKMHMRQKSAQLFMEDVKGVQQIPSCRDIVFLLLFVFHLLGIVYLGNTYGYEALRYHDDTDSDSSVTIVYQNLVFISLLSGVFAILISALVLLIMMILARSIVQIALILTISLSFAWGTMGIGLSPKKVVPATGIIVLALSVAYTIVVWDRCKFHGANLYASLSGIRVNPGAVVVAFFFQFLALVWSIYYTYVAIGVYDAVQDGSFELPSRGMKIFIYSSLGVSYYWTLQVFMNIVQVTVAGVIGSWWFTVDGDTIMRGQRLRVSFFNSFFYSIGSICYGSLFIGPVRLLRQLSALFRPSEENASLLCFHECIRCLQSCLTSCVDNLAFRFNPWSLTYVGLYGYNLTDAGLHATELFEKRGWSTIVSDDLVPNVLLLTCLVIGGVTGCFAHLIENFESLSLTSLNEPVTTSFVAGGLVGIVVSSVVLGIISSSVNTVIVCFASSPVDFHTNHPELSAEMRSAWREVWPGCMDVVDIRMAVASFLDPASNGGGEQQPLLG